MEWVKNGHFQAMHFTLCCSVAGGEAPVQQPLPPGGGRDASHEGGPGQGPKL